MSDDVRRSGQLMRLGEANVGFVVGSVMFVVGDRWLRVKAMAQEGSALLIAKRRKVAE